MLPVRTCFSTTPGGMSSETSAELKKTTKFEDLGIEWWRQKPLVLQVLKTCTGSSCSAMDTYV